MRAVMIMWPKGDNSEKLLEEIGVAIEKSFLTFLQSTYIFKSIFTENYTTYVYIRRSS